MPQDSRTVSRLALQSPRAEVDRAAFLIEDGLRTATLAGSERRLIVVRSIALGTIHPRESPVALSRRIERKWEEVERFAVPAESEAARLAPAVTFASVEVAFAAWLSGTVLGRQPADWFWRRVLPRNVEAMSAPDAFTRLALSVAAPPGGHPLSMVDFVEEVARRDALSTLAPLLRECHIEPLLELLLPGARREAIAVHQESARHARVELPPAYRHALLERVAASFGIDAVAHFLVTLAVLSKSPWLLSAPGELAAEVRRRLRPLVRPAAVEPPAVTAHGSDPQNGASVQRTADAEVAKPQPRASGTPGERSAQASGTTLTSPRVAPPEPECKARAVAPPAPVAIPAGDRSTFAGLFFVVPVLSRIGMDDPRQGFVPALLAAIASVAGAQADDPALCALNIPDAADDADRRAAITRWHVLARRYVRSEAKLLLSWLVRRDGRVVSTRSHIDVFFDLNQTDLRIRRLGLDLDPGWVPWLGKVIAYHYGCDDC